MAYMGVSRERETGLLEKSQGIDFKRFFRKQDAGSLRFISALRMGATFPFITPNVQLPSSPQMETMDSGLSDNFGLQDALKFMFVFREWISNNTSGVVLITIRDSKKIVEIAHKSPPSLFEKLFTPLKNIYTNWDNVQTLTNETAFNVQSETLPYPIDRIEFEYNTIDFQEDQNGLFADNLLGQSTGLELERASLNWRLTKKEKRSILNNIYSQTNQRALKQLQGFFPKVGPN